MDCLTAACIRSHMNTVPSFYVLYIYIYIYVHHILEHSTYSYTHTHTETQTSSTWLEQCKDILKTAANALKLKCNMPQPVDCTLNATILAAGGIPRLTRTPFVRQKYMLPLILPTNYSKRLFSPSLSVASLASLASLWLLWRQTV